jgi:outer membrane receptor protein involved in Fe transport
MQAHCKKLLSTLLLVLIFKISFAGLIKGKVVDAFTGEPLVGAVVKINNTKLKTLVKLDGTFSIANVPAGTYTITVTSGGYTIKEQIITVTSESDVKNVSFAAESTSTEITSVTVSTLANKDSDKGARRLEKVADPIINVLSSKTIQLLPDITVANALQRVSGVTIEKSNSGEGRYPIIRGMEKRYINTLVNGIKIPSPDNKNRFIPLDLFPSELLERLEVSKSLTPSMEGDAIGGTINLVMKDAPNKLLFQANGSLGYNSTFMTERYNKFSTKSMNTLSPAERYGATYQALYKDFPVDHLNYNNVNAPISSTIGLTVGNRFGKGKKFGFIISGSYQNIFKGTTSNFFLPNSQPGFNNIPIFSELQLRKYSIQSKRVGVTGRFDYHINSKNKLSITNTFVRLDDYQTRIVWDTIALNSLVDNWQRSQWTYQSINNTTLQGLHQLTTSTKIDWSLVYSIANNHIPDQSQFIHEYPIVATSLSGDKLQSMNRLWIHNSDKDYSAYANFTKTYSKVFELKFGVLVRNKHRDNFYNSYGLKPLLGSLYTNINNAVFQFNTPANGTPTASGNNYTFDETISAAYIQGKWNVTKKLEAIGGFRYENTAQKYQTQLGYDFLGSKYGNINYKDVLPSLQLKYALTQNQNVRLAYYKALARPGFAEMIPDGVDGEFFKEVGNPQNLQHTTADNFDLRYEYYSGNANQILLGVFYKKLDNPIESGAYKPAGVNSLYLSPQNSKEATNYGFEAVYTKYFGVFGVSANYTYTKSSITRDSMIYASSPSKYVSETRPLQGQSNHIGNISLIYKNPKLGLDVQVAGVYTGERIIYVSPYYGLHYWQSPLTQLDISFEKRIMKGLTFYGKINNITNAPYELSLHQSYNDYLKASGSRPLALQTSPDSKIIVQKDYYKVSYLFGLRYKL